MDTSDARQEAWQRVESLLTGGPTPPFDTVVSPSERAESATA